MSNNRSRSFKPAYSLRPHEYRTPSPPLNHVEPISPPGDRRSTFDDRSIKKRKLERGNCDPSFIPHHNYGSNTNGGGKPTQRPPAPINTAARPRRASGLDTLAEIATSPDYNAGRFDIGFKLPDSVTFPHRSPDASLIPPLSAQRHSKRSHSEVFGSRPDILTNSRPATSHISSIQGSSHGRSSSANFAGPAIVEDPRYPDAQSLQTSQQDNDSRFEIAELLLNLSRGRPNMSNVRAVDSQTTAPIHSAARAESNGYHTMHDPRPDSLKAAAQHQDASNKVTENFAVNEGVLPLQADIVPPTARNEDQSAVSTQDPRSSKPREHRGWPKGKPRVPRAGQGETKKRNKSNPKSSDLIALDRVGVKSRQRKPNLTTPNSEFDRFGSTREKPRLRRTSDPEAVLKEHIDRPEADKVTTRPPSLPPVLPPDEPKKKPKSAKISENNLNDFCSACHKKRNATNSYHESWICCNGCKTWLHASCAGFESERKTKEVDKFYCKMCQAKHGPTTFVRKSSRAHTSVDYAGLHEGKFRTSVDIAEHHYITPIKNGTLPTQPESFPRMRPELVTADFFYRCGGMAEPILIPAEWNPQPAKPGSTKDTATSQEFHEDTEYDCVPDEGQDSLDMVMPQDLTVRQVAELYGPNERVEVIDVKIQEGSEKPWNLRQWAEYYEALGEKPVRNVISLEVSQSKLGKLIRRPKVVRDLDLQDSVWPSEETAKGNYPAVQFYCLMSVADCFTDFHVDFGGSSVYYHILKGRKTFFFIPPKPKNLKKYEEWCRSPDQSSNFLGSICGECYRVDLYPGDTMLIPSGWIHAVWTPENSLVIGGNFLTRIHYAMQIQINEIEKTTGVARKFRYPYFQKVLWLTIIKYLEEDPVPASVVEKLCTGETFPRTEPVYNEFEPSDTEDPGLFNARLYPQGEIDGLLALRSYIHRTVMISIGKVAGITKGVQDAVIRSIPKFQGSPAEALQVFAMWTAWKRGNEVLPDWALPEAAKHEFEPSLEKRPTLAALRQMERQSLIEAQNQKASRRSQRHSGKDLAMKPQDQPIIDGDSETPSTKTKSPVENIASQAKDVYQQPEIPYVPKDDEVESPTILEHWGILKENKYPPGEDEVANIGSNPVKSPAGPSGTPSPAHQNRMSTFTGVVINRKGTPQSAVILSRPEPAASGTHNQQDTAHENFQYSSSKSPSLHAPMGAGSSTTDQGTPTAASTGKRSKARACAECRKTKRRCIHDEKGQVDPVKASERPVPRGANAIKRAAQNSLDQGHPDFKKPKRESDGTDSHLSVEIHVNGQGDQVKTQESSAGHKTQDVISNSHGGHEHQNSSQDHEQKFAVSVEPTNTQNDQTVHAQGNEISLYRYTPENVGHDVRSPFNATSNLGGSPPQELAPPPVEPNSPKQIKIPNGDLGASPTFTTNDQKSAGQVHNSHLETAPPRATSEYADISKYPPTSPLTELNPSSPVTSAVEQVNGTTADAAADETTRDNTATKQSPRNRKQVERNVDTQTPSRDTSIGPRPPSQGKTPSRSNGVLTMSKSIRSGSGTSHSASRDVPESGVANGTTTPSPSPALNKASSNSGKSTNTNTAGKSASPTSTEEDESLRLAHMLAAGEFGLRRRG